MQITLEWLIEKSACLEGREWFVAHFPDGGEYQAVLDELAKENRASYARWLLQKAGPVDTVLEVEELTAEASLFFAGRIVVKGAIRVENWLIARSIKAGGSIKAGWSIEAGESIKAGEGIKAGRSIKAGWGIKAGRSIKAGWGIEAGWSIEAGESIKAGDGIEAGWSIKAGGSIKAGEDYGIYAGLQVPISLKKQGAVVVARERPANLFLGEFRQIEDAEIPPKESEVIG